MVEEAGFEPANAYAGRFTVPPLELATKYRNELQQVIQKIISKHLLEWFRICAYFFGCSAPPVPHGNTPPVPFTAYGSYGERRCAYYEIKAGPIIGGQDNFTIKDRFLSESKSLTILKETIKIEIWSKSKPLLNS